MTNSQSLKTNKLCPYNVKEKISASDVESICNKNGISLVTSYEELAKDINLYYEGYFQHKRLYGGKKNTDCITKNQIEKKLEKVSNTTARLLQSLESLHEGSDDFLLTALDFQMYLASKRKESDIETIQSLIKTLKALKNEANRSKTDPDFDYHPGIDFESSSQQWFLGKAIPLIYEKHTGQPYSRAYNSGHRSCGKQHEFAKAILSYLDEFKKATDEAINTAPKNYQASLIRNKETGNSKEYGWPYE